MISGIIFVIGIVALNFLIYNLHKIRMTHSFSEIEHFWLIVPIGLSAVPLLKLYDKVLMFFQVGEDMTFYLSFGMIVINFFVLHLLLKYNTKSSFIQGQ